MIIVKPHGNRTAGYYELQATNSILPCIQSSPHVFDEHNVELGYNLCCRNIQTQC